MIEKKWPAISPRLLLLDGSIDGVITSASTKGIKVKQIIVLQAPAINPQRYQVKRVISKTKFIVGPIPVAQGKQSLTTRADLSIFTVLAGSYYYAEEQDKSLLKPDDIMQAIYRQEPSTTIGVEIDDQYGNPIDSIEDSNGINRLAVDGQFTAEVDVQVDVDVDGLYNEETNSDPDNVGLIGHARSENTNETDQTQRITARRGTVDVDTVSQDVAIHDHDGNKFDIRNPLPMTGSFEKFFTLMAASKWMELATYDEVVPTYTDNGSVLTLAYKEDGITIGEAVITYTSLESWTMKLNRWINDDDGSQLLDDDDQPLNLD